MIKREVIHATLGKGFADRLDEVIISAGEIVYTRREMIDFIGNANFNAAARLNKLLKRLKIKTLGQLAKISPYDLYKVKGCGDTTVYVAMCILDTHKYNVMDWWLWKDDDQKKKAIARAKRHLQEVA